MGKALYREYRPTTLDEVIGQEHITSTLKNALQKGAISHAYLFTGPRGVGKTSVARILAHSINDLPYDETKTYIDIIEIDAASNRRIDEIRDLRDKVHIAPTSSKYKVYIIDEVHMLTREAFNALLKTLEEPPAHAVFILATTEAHKVPETIVSRTQRYSFKPIEGDQAVAHLRTIADKEKLKIDDEALELLAEHGRGSFRDSISMLDQIAGFGHKTITKKEISTLLGVPDSSVIQKIIHAVSQGSIDEFFIHMQTFRELGVNPSKTAQSIISELRTEISGKDSEYSRQWAVAVMKELLPLTGTNGTFEALEISLLSHALVSEETDAVKPDVAMFVTEKSISKKVDKVEPKIVTKIKSTINIPEELKELEKEKPASWNTILDILKATHNTLYGVLRMADVSLKDKELTLVFQFDFHKKQLNQAKNLQTLQKIITDTLGESHQIIMTVKKNEKHPSSTKKPISSDALSSVSNIFDGAELLES